MPFNDTATFFYWMFGNLLWKYLDIGLTAIVVSIGAGIAVKLGFSQGWQRTFWTSAGVLVSVLAMLISIKQQPPLPSLSPLINGVAYGGQMNGQDNHDVILFVGISNSGQQSGSVKNYEVTANVNGKYFAGQMQTFARVTNLKVGDQSISYPDGDAIYDKLARKIEPGDQIAGLMQVAFPDLGSKELTYGDVSIKLSIVDVYNNSSSTTVKLTRNVGHIMNYPGLHPFIQ